jgi:hypothetical protein
LLHSKTHEDDSTGFFPDRVRIESNRTDRISDGFIPRHFCLQNTFSEVVSKVHQGVSLMQDLGRNSVLSRLRVIRCVAVLTLVGILSAPAAAQSWVGYGGDAQHTALSAGPSQIPQAIRWSTPVDLDPQYSGDVLLIHYGSPAITAKNTVLVPVKTGQTGGFEVNAINGATGQQIWSFTTDYVLPNHNWTPPMGITLTPNDTRVIIPGAGGTVWIRNSPNTVRGSVTRTAFYGNKFYNANPDEFNAAIQICTPITSDGAGNLYFGYVSTGAALPGYPNGIASGLARVSNTGVGSFVAAAVLANDATIKKPVYNCTPALSTDGSSLYIAVNQSNFTSGYLCKVTAATLTPIHAVLLKDPRNTNWDAALADDGTASPTIGPDGDVYYGVLEFNLGSNHERGWLLHFNSGLTATKTPGAFGWDDSASIVPLSVMGSNYNGTSSYLVLTKYNNYANGGGNGQNEVAVLDPNATMQDPITGINVMKTVATVLGPTKNPNLPGVDEWCINSAAIDTANQCAVINSEDGHVYRWSLATTPPTLSSGLNLAPPTGEAYTPTLIGPDGAVYAINRANLFCCVANNPNVITRGTTAAWWGRVSDFFSSDLHGAIWIVVLTAFLGYWASVRLRSTPRPIAVSDGMAGAKA